MNLFVDSIRYTEYILILIFFFINKSSKYQIPLKSTERYRNILKMVDFFGGLFSTLLTHFSTSQSRKYFFRSN